MLGQIGVHAQGCLMWHTGLLKSRTVFTYHAAKCNSSIFAHRQMRYLIERKALMDKEWSFCTHTKLAA